MNCRITNKKLKINKLIMMMLFSKCSSIVFKDGFQSWVDTLIQLTYFPQGTFSCGLCAMWTIDAWCCDRCWVVIFWRLPVLGYIFIKWFKGLSSAYWFFKVKLFWHTSVYFFWIFIIHSERIRQMSFGSVVLEDILFLVSFWPQLCFLILDSFGVRGGIQFIKFFFEHLWFLY